MSDYELYRTLAQHHEPGFYCGWRKDQSSTRPRPIVWTPSGDVLPLKPPLALKNASPTGFDWRGVRHGNRRMGLRTDNEDA